MEFYHFWFVGALFLSISSSFFPFFSFFSFSFTLIRCFFYYIRHKFYWRLHVERFVLWFPQRSHYSSSTPHLTCFFLNEGNLNVRKKTLNSTGRNMAPRRLYICFPPYSSVFFFHFATCHSTTVKFRDYFETLFIY